MVDVVKTFQVGNAGIDFDDDLFGGLENFRGCTDGCTWYYVTILVNSSGLYDCPIEGFVGFSVFLLEAVVTICQVLREHCWTWVCSTSEYDDIMPTRTRKVLIREVDTASIDSFCYVFPDLMRVSASNPTVQCQARQCYSRKLQHTCPDAPICLQLQGRRMRRQTS